MSAPFLAGAVAGYAIAIPVGAIAVLIVEQGLRRGFRPAFAAGAGAATADGLYATVAVVAGAAVAAVIGPLERPLRVLAAAVLLAIAGAGAYRLARSRRSAKGAPAAGAASATAPGDAPDPVAPGTTGARAVYLRFTALTLVNPQTVVYFAALILGLPDVLGTPADRASFVVGAFLASLSWQTLLAAIGAVGHRRLPAAFRTGLSIVGYVVIAGFALAILASAA